MRPHVAGGGLGTTLVASRQRSHEVGNKLPNGWGLFDTAGNVTEWCNDAYSDAGYGQGPLVDPVAWTEDVAERIVVRGGNFFRGVEDCIAGPLQG